MVPPVNVRNKLPFEGYYQSASRAAITCFTLFLVTICFYVAFQLHQGSMVDRCIAASPQGTEKFRQPVPDLQTRAKCSADNTKACMRTREPTPCDTLVMYRDSGFFDIYFNESALKKFYDIDRVNDFKKDILAQNEDIKQEFARRRSYVIAHLRDYVDGVFGNDPPLHLPVIPLGQVSNDITSISLAWLLEQIDILDNLSVTELGIPAVTPSTGVYTPTAQNKHALHRLGNIKKNVDILMREEMAAKEALKKRQSELDPQISFIWLYHPGNGWLVELVFWSLFGLYSCTLVNIVKKVSNKKYCAREFCMFFPRILLAPVMALIVVALISSGYSVQDQNLNNFPYFLMLAFFLGFNSESLNALIRDISNKILRPIAFSSARLREANRTQPYIPRYAEAGKYASGVTATTLQQLKQNIKAEVAANAEQTAVLMAKQRWQGNKRD